MRSNASQNRETANICRFEAQWRQNTTIEVKLRLFWL